MRGEAHAGVRKYLAHGMWAESSQLLGTRRSLSSGRPRARARIKGDTNRALQGTQEVDRETRLGCGR